MCGKIQAHYRLNNADGTNNIVLCKYINNLHMHGIMGSASRMLMYNTKISSTTCYSNPNLFRWTSLTSKHSQAPHQSKRPQYVSRLFGSLPRCTKDLQTVRVKNGIENKGKINEPANSKRTSHVVFAMLKITASHAFAWTTLSIMQ